jgi:GNAT superfamily N-acetyltransferase
VVKSDAPATIALTFVPEPGAEPAHIRKPVSSRADVVQRARNDVLRYLRANVVDRVGHRCSPPRPVRSEANMPNDDAKADPDITLTDELDPADFAVIADGLSAYDFARIGYLDFRRLSVVVRDPQTGKVVGGLYGRSSLGLFYVDWLFLPEDLRGSGIGSRVLAMAEEEAQRRGCTRVTLTTLSVEAPGFYQKQGYDIAVTIDCEPPGLIHYYMMKRLVPLRR